MTLDPDSPTRHAPDTGPGGVTPIAPARAPSTPGLHAADASTRAEPCAPVAADPLPPVPGYELLALLGRGGMGVVYKARHAATGRVVALKLVTPRGAYDGVARDRFAREVRSLAELKHPNVVPVFHAGEWAGFPYCTMEYAPGGTLSEHLERVRTDRAAAVRLVAKVARAVEYLHARGIVHRDLKPLNILLGPGDEPLVADFGLARWLDRESDLTCTAVPVGTRPYMAPEQTLGRQDAYTPACDVWALGVTLYEVLTGRRPFADDGTADVFDRIRTAEPLPLAAATDAPPELQGVVSRCLAKAPADRYPTAAALADDLDRWLAGDPVLAPLPPRATSSPAPRRRAARAAVVVCVLVLAALATSGDVATRTAAGKLAGGKPVRLTDDTGAPLVAPVDEPTYSPHHGKLDGYTTFSHVAIGVTSLLDEPLCDAYRVEADVGVAYQSPALEACAGIYVGRRAWPGLPFTQESALLATVSPGFDTPPGGAKKERRLCGGLHRWWWPPHSNGDLQCSFAPSTAWDVGPAPDRLRFARVRVDVRSDAVAATIDGVSPPPWTAAGTARSLWLHGRFMQQREGTPECQYEGPPFGCGIGVYCRATTCVVRNLTVTRLTP